MTTTGESIEAKAAELGLTMQAKFIPWSQSRHAGEGLPCLNWKVTIYLAATAPGKSPRVVLTTDYMAGQGHCPSYRQSNMSNDRAEAVKRECETGHAVKWLNSGPQMFAGRGEPILPRLADVLHSLVSDAGAIDHSGFEDWASEYGYDTDSRKAEAIYRACLDIGLKLRNTLGEAKLAELREACQDY